jgi:hypothetical protein
VATRRQGGDEPAADAGRASSTLRVWLVNQAREDDESVAMARREARTIWADAALALAWIDGSDPEDAPGRPPVTIILRDVLPGRRGADPRPDRAAGDSLAWTLFDGGEPTGTIEVSRAAVAGLVMREIVAGKRVCDLPLAWRRQLVGRALGRVIAHEIGHWLWGTGHSGDGLMRAGLSGPTLIAMRPPGLPRGSIGAAATARLARATSVATPPAHH